jgi:hypothetical protein
MGQSSTVIRSPSLGCADGWWRPHKARDEVSRPSRFGQHPADPTCARAAVARVELNGNPGHLAEPSRRDSPRRQASATLRSPVLRVRSVWMSVSATAAGRSAAKRQTSIPSRVDRSANVSSASRITYVTGSSRPSRSGSNAAPHPPQVRRVRCICSS